MKKLIIIMISILCIANKCKDEGENCHLKILIKNQSNQNIMYGWNIQNTSDECNLSVSIIYADGTYEYTRNNGWESILANGQTAEFYIVDPDHYNLPGVFYDCDLIEINNTILKHYVLTLEDLKNSNFTITYP